VCCKALNLTGYSVSSDGGKTFTDMGDAPFRPNVQPIGDPAVAVDDAGNFFLSSLALSSAAANADSLVSLYVMPKGSNRFKLLSVPVNVGSQTKFFADKSYLAIGRDASGTQHFYVTWTFFSAKVASPIMLTESTDGLHWNTTRVADPTACSQASTPLPAGNTLFVSYEQAAPVAVSPATPIRLPSK
jgi:hypothetical protein